MTERVEWLDWGEEAFRRARTEDKPVLLAIVVAWDAWCRLMESDTYGDPQVAMLLNRDYIPVRVDADRRPDINDRYNVGGWPSTVFLTPEGDLLWGAASIDPAQMKQVLVRLREGFSAQRAKLADAIRERDAKIAKARAGFPAGQPILGEDTIRRTLRGIVGTYDALSGGFAPPKFPMIASLRLLIQALFESGGDEFRTIIQKTLDVMAERGLRDRVEGGFHRLAAGEGWGGVRTEKLALDSAGHIRLYLDAAAVFGEARYAATAKETVAWVMKTLHDPERGTFAASQQADDGYFGLDAKGRVSHPAPAIDRTLFAEANAELASALMQASTMLPRESFGTAAQRAMETMLTECRHAKLGIVRYRGREAGGFGLLRDQAAVARALIDAYEFSADRRFLAEAERLVALIWEGYWDEAEQGLLDRLPGYEELGELRLRRKNVDDNAVACEASIRLSIHTGAERWRAKAERALAGFPDYGPDYGHHTAHYAVALDWLIRPATEITIIAPAAAGWVEAMRSVALGTYVPRRVVRWYDPELDREAIRTRGFDTLSSPCALVARKGRVLAPARSPSELAQRLGQL